jgi:hypothetical protein
MLNFTSKSLFLVLYFIGHEEGVVLVEEYDKRSFISYAYKMPSSFTSYAII